MWLGSGPQSLKSTEKSYVSFGYFENTRICVRWGRRKSNQPVHNEDLKSFPFSKILILLIPGDIRPLSVDPWSFILETTISNQKSRKLNHIYSLNNKDMKDTSDNTDCALFVEENMGPQNEK